MIVNGVGRSGTYLVNMTAFKGNFVFLNYNFKFISKKRKLYYWCMVTGFHALNFKTNLDVDG